MKFPSEYNKSPKYLITHNPASTNDLESISKQTLKEYHYLSMPDKDSLYNQYDDFVKMLNSLKVNQLELVELLSKSERKALADKTSPNLMFTRDPAVTLPWQPDVFIKCRFQLTSRKEESKIMYEALTNLGLRSILEFENDEFIEGGDVLPVYFSGQRTLVVGFGMRTTQAAALKLAKFLIPEHTDEIIGLRHDPDILHLDTGFTVLNDNTILVIKGMFSEGFVIDKAHRLTWLNPLDHATSLGIKILYIDRHDAIENEQCNFLPLGNNKFISFHLPYKLKEYIVSKSQVEIYEVSGDELAKAAGGTHCLSRPVY